MQVYEFQKKIRILIPATKEVDAADTAEIIFATVRDRLTEVAGGVALIAVVEGTLSAKTLPIDAATVRTLAGQEEMFLDLEEKT